ncbi:uncharacterized protein EV420DRAFT_1647071 [Desarmillaria tabescens]|uniref:Uncharacterized protein n=1 Tax=Armillaria tabescens TaxID=1929756 RepID=A0AA39MWD3_ARMTA|nr:uncharacterized protein EV420DRAFT_1647071 [Desarmillaria tabescens]KAK0449042.1 hypothetical protein EV420DRAFT_1647071 [Desarmillaria tabescens]
MSGSMFPTITRTPLTKQDTHTARLDRSVTERERRSGSNDGAFSKRVKAVDDIHLDNQRSEIEKYFAHLAQAEQYKANSAHVHEDVGYITDTALLANEVRHYAQYGRRRRAAAFLRRFDLYTMDSSFLRDAYMVCGMLDHEALYETLMRRQVAGHADARITLRKGLWENGAAVSADIRDPRSFIPIPLRLTLITEMDITYSEEELDFFVDRDDYLRTNVPGVFANLEFENECLCYSKGRFLMNRCWTKTQPDGSVVELFEGYMEMKVRNGTYFLADRGEDINMIEHAFWAIRYGNEVDLDDMNVVEEGTLD